MDWKLVFQLSLFGLAMGIATVFVIPPKVEPACWFVIFLICAYIIAKKRTDRHFLHGWFVSIVNSVWITAAHILFFDQYLPNHPQEASMVATMSTAFAKLMMTLTGPLFGVISGLVLGLFAFIAGKLVKPPVTSQA